MYDTITILEILNPSLRLNPAQCKSQKWSVGFPYLSVTQSANIGWLKNVWQKSWFSWKISNDDWLTHHQGQRVFCFCVIFRVCLISKITKESHSKMENLHRKCLKVHHSKLLQSFTSPSSPHCKLTLITDLAKFRVDCFFYQGPGWIWSWFFY